MDQERTEPRATEVLGPFLEDVRLRHLDFDFETEGLDAEWLVYGFGTENQGEQSRLDGIWKAGGKDLESRGHEWHHIVSFSEAPALAAESSTGTVLKRLHVGQSKVSIMQYRSCLAMSESVASSWTDAHSK